MQPYLPYFTFIHSILRYFILVFALIVTFQSIMGMMGKGKFKKVNKQMALFLLIFCDLQLLLGVVLYLGKGWLTRLSAGGVMTDPYARFWAVEHGVGMIVAIVLVHLGYTVTKKNMDDDHKFKRLFWFNFIALAIFVATIPWEGKKGGVGRPNIPTLNTGM